jgi:hypothetical protein
MGHSLGSLASFGTAGVNTHIRTSVHHSGGLTGNPVGFDQAALKTMTKPAAFLCGGADTQEKSGLIAQRLGRVDLP